MQTTIKINPDSLDVFDGLRCNMQPSPDLWQKVPGYSSDDEAAATWEYRLLQYRQWFETNKNQPALLVSRTQVVEPLSLLHISWRADSQRCGSGPWPMWMMIVHWSSLKGASIFKQPVLRSPDNSAANPVAFFWANPVPSWRNFCISCFFSKWRARRKRQNMFTDL